MCSTNRTTAPPASACSSPWTVTDKHQFRCQCPPCTDQFGLGDPNPCAGASFQSTGGRAGSIPARLARGERGENIPAASRALIPVRAFMAGLQNGLH